MTTYQDPPLHSRRAARQGERAEAENTSAETSAERAIAAGTAEPLNYATTSRPPLPQYDGQSLRPRRSIENPVENPIESPADGLTATAGTADDSTVQAQSPTTDPDVDAPNYRPRDYSPEGRRAAQSWGPQYGGVADDGTVDFQTQARENVPAPAAEADPAPESVAESAPLPVAEASTASIAAAPVVNEHAEHTMTRRELRALREAGLITDVTDLSLPIPLPVQPAGEPVAEAPVADPTEAPATDAPAEAPADEAAPAPEADVAVEVPAAVAPIADPVPLVAPAPQTSSRLDSALAEFDALAAGREPLAPSPDAPTPVTGRRAAAPLVEDETSQEASSVEPASFEPEPGAEPEAEAEVIESAPVEPEPVESQAGPSSDAPSPADLFPQPEALPPSTEGLSAFDALFQPPSASIPVVVALPVDENVVHHDVVEAELEPEPAAPASDGAAPATDASATSADAAVDQLHAAPAPQGAPALVPPPPIAYPTPFDLPAPPATQSPVEVAATPFAPTSFAVGAPPVAPVAPVAEPAVGHWSTQADIDDAEQINDSTISRSVGAGNGAITTSALVLPSVPEHAIGGPMGDGGEILLTGSISLPGSLSATGAHPSQLDESDLDHLLDPGDHQVAATDSTPVRAIRAVSTHTASGGIISPSKPKGTRGFTILIIAASVMAVVVVGLLVAGLVSGTL